MSKAKEKNTFTYCCGKDHNSKFCPECGKKLDLTDDLSKLKEYLTRQLDSAIRNEKSQIESCLIRGDEYKHKPQNGYKNPVEKWTTWVMLVDVIASRT